MTADNLTDRPSSTAGKLFKAAWRTFLATGLAWAFLWPVMPTLASKEGYLAVACLRRNAGQCGVINENADWVVRPQFDRIGDFAPNGRAVAARRGKPGLIDTRGEWVIPPGLFERMDEEWSAGFLKVGRSDRKAGWLYGLVDEAGRQVVEPSFREIQRFGPNQLAGACDQEDRCGFIDTRGAWVVPPLFDRVEPFSENGLAPARRPGEDRWGYVNNLGAFIIPPAYEQAFPFYGDRAKVFSGGRYRLINSKGQAVGGNQFANLGDFDSRGLASAQMEIDGLFGLVNRAGAWVVPPRFERLFSFNGGNLAPAQQNGLYGFINRSGQWVIKPAFGNVDDFESLGRRAPAALSGAWGLINAQGEWVVDPNHLLLLNTGGVLGFVQVFAENGRWGLMDENGRWLLEPILNASPFFAANGLSEARVGNLYGFINRFGHWVVKPSFQQVGVFRPVPAVPPALSGGQAARPSASPGSTIRPGSPEASARARPSAQTEAADEPRRRTVVRQDPAPTRFVLPDKPPEVSPPTGYISTTGPASAQTEAAVEPRRRALTRQDPAPTRLVLPDKLKVSPPTGYIPPSDPTPVRRTRPPADSKEAADSPGEVPDSQTPPNQ